jgi:putative transcriptional regulator
MTVPTQSDIRAARESAGLTQADACRFVRAELRTWQHREAGDRAMHPGLWELFRLKIGAVLLPKNGV